MTKKTKLVQSAEEAIANIRAFQSELAGSSELQARVAYSRAWYAFRLGRKWIFGPSKFIGYSGMTAREYTGPNNDRDGRKTEDRLQDWFEEAAGPELQRELAAALADYLATYGKEPSKKARINVLRNGSHLDSGAQRAPQPLVELLVAVCKMLPADQLRLVRDRI